MIQKQLEIGKKKVKNTLDSFTSVCMVVSMMELINGNSKRFSASDNSNRNIQYGNKYFSVLEILITSLNFSG